MVLFFNPFCGKILFILQVLGKYVGRDSFKVGKLSTSHHQQKLLCYCVILTRRENLDTSALFGEVSKSIVNSRIRHYTCTIQLLSSFSIHFIKEIQNVSTFTFKGFFHNHSLKKITLALNAY